MIPTEFRDEIMMDGINFLRTITRAYGAEDGMRLWTQISDVLDPAIKGDILVELLCANTSADIVLRKRDEKYNKILAVKAYRAATDASLKEAVDAINSFEQTNKLEITLLAGVVRHKIITEFRKAGCYTM